MGHNGGRLQVGLQGQAPYYDFPFINACKMAGFPWSGASTTDEYRSVTFMDSRGCPRKMLTGGGASWQTNQLWIYGHPGEIWVLDWPGSATMALSQFFTSGGMTEAVISSNRREYTLTGSGMITTSPQNAGLVRINISAMADDTFAGGEIRLYRKVDESLINAGNVFNTGFLDRVSQFGMKRFMDCILDTGQDNNITSLNHRRREDDVSYFGGKVFPSLWCGSSIGTSDQVVSQPSSTISSWSHGTLVHWKMVTKPAFQTATAATNANPVVFTKTGHGLSSGNNIQFEPAFDGSSSWQALTQHNLAGGSGAAWRVHAVTVLDADTFSIPINSTAFGAYPGTYKFTKEVTLKVGALAAIPCSRLPLASNFYSTEFTNGQVVTGVYDAVFGRLMFAGDSMTYAWPGWPIETIVRLANAAGSHPYINFGNCYDDAHVAFIMTYVRDNLDAGLVPRYGYGNENWNTGHYWGTSWSRARAKLDPLISVHDNHYFYGKRISDISDIAATVYAGRLDDFKIVMEVQAVGYANTGFTVNRFQCSPISAGNPALYPINKVDVIAYNGYWTAPFFGRGASAAAFPGYVAAVLDYLAGGTAGFDWLREACLDARYGSTLRQNSHAYSLDDFIYVSNNTGCIFRCSTAGTSAGSQPAGFASASGNGTAVTDGTAVFTSWDVLQSVNYYRDVVGPAWKTLGASYTGRRGNGVGITEYEAGMNLIGPNAADGGFPTGGVSVADIQNFIYDFFANSYQAGQLDVRHAQDFLSIGGEFPAQFTVAGPWDLNTLWGSYRLNDYAADPTRRYSMLKAWNNGKRPIVVKTV